MTVKTTYYFRVHKLYYNPSTWSVFTSHNTWELIKCQIGCLFPTTRSLDDSQVPLDYHGHGSHSVCKDRVSLMALERSQVLHQRTCLQREDQCAHPTPMSMHKWSNDQTSNTLTFTRKTSNSWKHLSSQFIVLAIIVIQNPTYFKFANTATAKDIRKNSTMCSLWIRHTKPWWE
jgi:hypothetical protein